MTIYGYARVSTAGQDYAGQVEALEAAGCEQIFAEHASAAAGRRRPQLTKALSLIGPGDILVVTRLSRLARSTRDALNILSVVTERGAAFNSLAESWADTTTPAGRLLVTIMAGLAEFDREMILERTSEGRRAARARGVRMGRRPRLSAAQVEFIREARQRPNPPTIGSLRRVLGVSRSTIVRAIGEAYAAAPSPPPEQIDLEEVIADASETVCDLQEEAEPAES